MLKYNNLSQRWRLKCAGRDASTLSREASEQCQTSSKSSPLETLKTRLDKMLIEMLRGEILHFLRVRDYQVTH